MTIFFCFRLFRFEVVSDKSIIELPTSTLRVVVGAHKLYDTNEAGQKRHTVKQAVLHERYKSTVLGHGDIMLLKVSPSIKFNEEYVRPICVDDYEFPPGTPCMVTGWGTTNPDTKRTVTTLVIATSGSISPPPRSDIGYVTGFIHLI